MAATGLGIRVSARAGGWNGTRRIDVGGAEDSPTTSARPCTCSIVQPRLAGWPTTVQAFDGYCRAGSPACARARDVMMGCMEEALQTTANPGAALTAAFDAVHQYICSRPPGLGKLVLQLNDKTGSSSQPSLACQTASGGGGGGRSSALIAN